MKQTERKKLFLADLDGTLLNREKKVSPATRQALSVFLESGGAFAICTGRAMESALTVFRSLELELPGSFIVAYNGAQIYDWERGETIYRVSIPLEVTADLFEMSREFGIHVQSYTDSHIIARDYKEEMVFYRREVHSPVIITDDPMSEQNIPPCKLLAIELKDKSRLTAFRTLVTDRFGESLAVFTSNDYYLEIVPRQVNKGAALRRLAAYLQIPIERTMAAGDAENDLAMLEAAGLGIAMCNGSDQVRARADLVTERDHDHDGLVPFLLGEV